MTTEELINAAKSGITLDYGDSAATLLCRPNLLRDFLMENGVWEDGRFVRTGFGIFSKNRGLKYLPRTSWW
jgi:hypothetical protein